MFKDFNLIFIIMQMKCIYYIYYLFISISMEKTFIFIKIVPVKTSLASHS